MAPQAEQARPRLTLERTFDASVEEVWDLWTTKEGIESWWGPDGFEVEVHRLDLRAGGAMEYSMRATGADQIDYMKKAGMPLITHHQVTFTEVTPRARLAYTALADFIPGVKPYEVKTAIDFKTTPDGVGIVLSFDAMHDDRWTRLAVMGRESELGRLAELLRRRRAGA
jgi:uncharacterized protein YndB with AHSA1/START domain